MELMPRSAFSVLKDKYLILSLETNASLETSEELRRMNDFYDFCRQTKSTNFNYDNI